MILKTFVEGPIDANNYLLIDEESKEIENLIKKGRDSIFGNDRMS